MRQWIKDIAANLAEQFKQKKQVQIVGQGGIGIQCGGDLKLGGTNSLTPSERQKRKEKTIRDLTQPHGRWED